VVISISPHSKFQILYSKHMIQAIRKRRSVRQYLPKEVDNEKLQDILLAAMYAPSANHIRPWELVVVQDDATKDRLSKVTPWAGHAKEAGAVIAVIGHPDESSEWVEDCSIVAQHIWLEATEQELSSCWIQIRGKESAEKEIKKILGIPDEHRVLCLMPIGVSAEEVSEHTEEEFEKEKIRYERY